MLDFHYGHIHFIFYPHSASGCIYWNHFYLSVCQNFITINSNLISWIIFKFGMCFHINRVFWLFANINFCCGTLPFFTTMDGKDNLVTKISAAIGWINISEVVCGSLYIGHSFEGIWWQCDINFLIFRTFLLFNTLYIEWVELHVWT